MVAPSPATGLIPRGAPTLYRGAPPGGGEEEIELSDELSDDGAREEGTCADDAVLLFVGGPLDGRVEIRPARHGEPLPTVTHIHLHDGPKVVHRYDLQPLSTSAGVYHLRSSAHRPAHDEAAADRSAD
jgi:hypothetical protein